MADVRKNLDYLMLATVVLCCLGLVMAVSVSGPRSEGGHFIAMQKQGANLAAGLCGFLVLAMMPLHLLWRFASLGFWVGVAIANADAMPSWLPGDEFEAVRKAALEAVRDR